MFYSDVFPQWTELLNVNIPKVKEKEDRAVTGANVRVQFPKLFFLSYAFPCFIVCNEVTRHSELLLLLFFFFLYTY